MSCIDRNQSHPDMMAGVGTDMEPHETMTAESTSATADAIMLPSRKAAIRRAREVVQKTSEMREDRIEQLSQALNAGKLILDSQLLADRLIGTQLKELQSAA